MPTLRFAEYENLTDKFDWDASTNGACDSTGWGGLNTHNRDLFKDVNISVARCASSPVPQFITSRPEVLGLQSPDYVGVAGAVDHSSTRAKWGSAPRGVK